MRPIYLKMSAFGPFLHEECVDFDRLSQNGLFLITGQTGSGKTTIFDAITFALYGEASGSNRDAKTFRSDLAKDEETYVELTFIVRNEVYKITRSPSYFKEGRKTAIAAKADLVLPDGRIISGPKDVNSEVLKILGLEVNQFKQIAMIAQGEFTKLLFASSDDKEKIFRKIFNTYKYEQFENMLKEKTKELKEKVDASNIQMKAFIDSIDQPFEGDYESYLTRLLECIQAKKEEYEQAYQDSDGLRKQINDMHIQLDQEREINRKVTEKKALEEQLQGLTNKKEVYSNKEKRIQSIELASTLIPYEQEVLSLSNQVSSAKVQLQQLEENLKQNESVFEVRRNNYNTLPQLKQTHNELLVQAESLNKKVEDRKKVLILQQSKQKSTLSLQKVESNLQKREQYASSLQSQKEKLTQQIEAYSQLAARKDEIELKSNTITSKINAYNQLQKEKGNYARLKRSHEKLSIQFTNADEVLKQHEAIHRDHESLFYSMQAGILASTLVEGTPCPVCGSIHHPSLAKQSDVSITSDSLEKEKGYIEAERKQRDTIYQQVFDANTAKVKSEERINSFIENYSLEGVTAETLNEEYESCTKEYSKVVTAIKELEQLRYTLEQVTQEEKKNLDHSEQEKKYREEVISEIASIDGQIQSIGTIDPDLDDKINQLKKDYSTINNQIKKYEDEYQEMIQYIQQVNGKKEQLTNTITTTSEALKTKNNEWLERLKVFTTYEEYNEYKQLIPTVNTLRKEVEDYKLNIQKVSGALSTIQLTRNELLDLSSLVSTIEQVEQVLSTKQTALQNVYTVINNYEKVYNNVSRIYQRSGQQVKQYNLYYELYSVTKGDNPQKLSFERYILSAYFEQIILLANIRLKDMTNNRYALVRKETKSRSQSGLDLQVKDYQSGTIREITTLSGGESFKAALSLALGLSDMIQQVTGGIELNTLFIDEGFGSLDQESLDQAIKVLMTLNESNKMIGIISHVTELKQRIDNQLNVMKDSKGSYIDMK